MSVFTYLNLKESYFFPSGQCLYSLYSLHSESFNTNTERSENPRNKVPHDP